MAITDNFIDEEHDDDLTREEADDSELVKRLRGQLKSANKRGKRVDELEGEIRTLKGGQMLSKANLTKGGEAVTLSDRQRQTLLREVDGDVTPEALRDAAVELGWAEPAVDPAAAEVAEQQEIANATKGATPKGAGEITPDVAAAWPMERRRDFIKQHPSEWERLKKGETVSGVTF